MCIPIVFVLTKIDLVRRSCSSKVPVCVSVCVCVSAHMCVMYMCVCAPVCGACMSVGVRVGTHSRVNYYCSTLRRP